MFLATIAIVLGTSIIFHDFARTPLVVASLIMCFAYVVAVGWLEYHNHHAAVAYLLVFFYWSLASGIVWFWGIEMPVGLLMFTLVIVLAGILLTSFYSLLVAILSGLMLIVAQLAYAFGLYVPFEPWRKNPDFSNVAIYCTMFGLVALISWLYNREMERSLILAKQAEAELIQQKKNLKKQVKQRTADLKRAQLEEMRQLHRFIKIGQDGATLLHDLANHLTTLTIEVEGLQSVRHSKRLAIIQQTVRHLEKIVASTRDRLQGSPHIRRFDLAKELDDAVELLAHRATKFGVRVDWQPPSVRWQLIGDPTCFYQVVLILISNAIEAYGTKPAKNTNEADRRVVVRVEHTGREVVVRIHDWGRGIEPGRRPYLFRPFQTTKDSGLGLGLFIAKESTETYFSGRLSLNAKSDHTEFVMRLPHKDRSIT